MESSASSPSSLTELHSHRLANGLRVILIEDHSVPIVTTMLWYGVGSRLEPKGASGIAHFLEHMMFRGTRSRSDGTIDLQTALNGGHNNAFTSYDHTAYHFSFSADRWPVALDLEADRMVNLELDQESLEVERQVILEEIRMTRDNPWEPLRQAVDAAAFPGHPYGRPVIGAPEDVANISALQLIEFYRLHYTTGNSVLAIAGDIHPEQSLDFVRAAFESIPPSPVAESGMGPPKRCHGGLVPDSDRPGQVARILIALPAPPAAHSEFVVHHVLDNLLAGGRLSRLHHRLVETEELASMVVTDLEETRFPYHCFVRAELTDGGNKDRALAAILEELDRLGREPVRLQELERAKHQTVVQHLQDSETAFDRSYRAGLFELLGATDWSANYLAYIEAIGPDELMEAACRYAAPADAWVAFAGTRSSRG
jgi:zinc protease